MTVAAVSVRYAVYFTPEPGSPAERLGASLLGRSAVTGRRLRQPAPELSGITGEPRRYGFHATLKAPFALAEGVAEQDLRAALDDLAASLAPWALPGCDVATVGEGTFLALVPQERDPRLDELAARCVRELDRFRAPLAQADIERRGPLPPRERDLLLRWGYPYVLEAFRFHITLTDSLPDAEQRADVAKQLRALCAPLLDPGALVASGLGLFVQTRKDRAFRMRAWFPFKSK